MASGFPPIGKPLVNDLQSVLELNLQLHFSVGCHWRHPRRIFAKEKRSCGLLQPQGTHFYELHVFGWPVQHHLLREDWFTWVLSWLICPEAESSVWGNYLSNSLAQIAYPVERELTHLTSIVHRSCPSKNGSLFLVPSSSPTRHMRGIMTSWQLHFALERRILGRWLTI